jgi:uncharacterized protein (DUF433 family)
VADTESPIQVDPEIQGGTPCFAGTRVPVKSLFDALDRGRSLDDFLEQFPSVSREAVEHVLRIEDTLDAADARIDRGEGIPLDKAFARLRIKHLNRRQFPPV